MVFTSSSYSKLIDKKLYTQMVEKLNHCHIKNTVGINYSQQVRAGFFQAQGCDNFTTTPFTRNLKDINRFSNTVTDIQLAQVINRVDSKASLNALIKNAMQLEGMSRLDGKTLDFYINKVCQELCTKSERVGLRDYAKAQFAYFLEMIRQGQLKTYNQQEAVQSLNERVEQLNAQQQAIVDAYKKTKSKDSPEVKEAYAMYIMKYEYVASDNVGRLLYTDQFQSEIGEVRSLDQVSSVSYKSIISYNYKKHRLIKDKVMCKPNAKGALYPCPKNSRLAHRFQVALQQNQNKLFKHAQIVRRAAQQVDLKTLIKHSPAIAGKILYYNPYALGRFCQALIEIDKEEPVGNIVKTIDNVALSLDAASLAMMLSGIAEAPGVATAMVAQGVKAIAKAVLKKVLLTGMKRAATPGFIGAGFHAFSSGARAYNFKQEYDTALGSLIAEARTEKDFDKVIQLEIDYKKNLHSALLSGSLLTLGSVNGVLTVMSKTGQLARLVGNSAGLSARLVAQKNLNLVIGQFSKHKALIGKLNKSYNKGIISSQQFERFLAAMAVAPQLAKKYFDALVKLPLSNMIRKIQELRALTNACPA